MNKSVIKRPRFTVCLPDGDMEYNTDSMDEAFKCAESTMNVCNCEVLILDKKANIKISIDKMRRV